MSLFSFPSLFLSLVGITINQFEELLLDVKKSWTRKKRLRKTTWRSNLLMTLIFLRQYVNHRFLGWIFQIHQCTVSREIQEMLHSLHTLVVNWIGVPPLDIRIKNSKLFKGAMLAVIVDGTEQQISIPSEKNTEQFVFSGKKKKHTFTRLITVSPQGRIYALSPSHPGSFCDLNLIELYPIHKQLSEIEWVAADKGFRGCHNQHNFILPFLEGDNPLTTKQVEFNNSLASIRTVVENTISMVKKWKICSQTFRCKFSSLDKALSDNTMVWSICAAFVNRFSLQLRQ